MAHNLILILPELVLFIGAMGLLLLGAYYKEAGAVGVMGEAAPHNTSNSRSINRIVSNSAIGLLVVASALTFLDARHSAPQAFNGAFIMDDFAVLFKVMIFLSTALALLMAQRFMAREKLERFEFPVLLLLAACGMGVMVSANNMIAAYMGLELQSLALYVVAAIKRDSLRATEAGLKYFVLGALSSGLLLYGMSLLYGLSGSVEFSAIASVFSTSSEGVLPVAQTVGLVFVMAGLAFKVSAVPFHMWTPDVYEGAPTPVTAFFAAAPKLAAMALFLRLITTAFPDAIAAWQQIFVFLAIAGMVLGSFAAIGQHNIKRLMAYSSIAHIGFALVGFAAATSAGISSVIFYMMLYLTMTLGTFACILAMRRGGVMLEQISDLAGLSRSRPFMAACLAVLMFSLAGIPPMAGFFGKLFVFRAAIEAELYALAIIGVLASVVGAFYYLRIIKIMYLDAAAGAETDDAAPTHDDLDDRSDVNEAMPRELAVIAGVFAGVSLFFFIYPAPLIELATLASDALMATGGAIK